MICNTGSWPQCATLIQPDDKHIVTSTKWTLNYQTTVVYIIISTIKFCTNLLTRWNIQGTISGYWLFSLPFIGTSGWDGKYNVRQSSLKSHIISRGIGTGEDSKFNYVCYIVLAHLYPLNALNSNIQH